MTKLEALKELLAKVKDRAEELEVLEACCRAELMFGHVGYYMPAMDAWRGYLDHAKALHDAVLTDAPYWIEKKIDGEFTAGIFISNLGRTIQASGPSDACAWLICILKALIAEEQEA